jgi:hypothetical protein
MPSLTICQKNQLTHLQNPVHVSAVHVVSNMADAAHPHAHARSCNHEIAIASQLPVLLIGGVCSKLLQQRLASISIWWWQLLHWNNYVHT